MPPGRLGMTGAPGLADALIVAELSERARRPGGVGAWLRAAEQVGWCAHPVRLSGGVEHADARTGEVRSVVDSDHEPDGVLLKACGSRRAARCPACAEVYRRDAFQLVRAGLGGGKGVPSSVAGHPMVFVTFTAPSFGVVHTRRERGGSVYPCHPGKLGDHCAHGRRRACWHRHENDDPVLGEPICADCFDYVGAVIWNALAPELWRRTTIYLRRALARAVGVSRAALDRQVRVSYLKVAEFQRRGLVHYHAIIRLDGKRDSETDSGAEGAEVPAPPEAFTVEVLVRAVREAARAVSAPLPAALGVGGWDRG